MRATALLNFNPGAIPTEGPVTFSVPGLQIFR